MIPEPAWTLSHKIRHPACGILSPLKKKKGLKSGTMVQTHNAIIGYIKRWRPAWTARNTVEKTAYK